MDIVKGRSVRSGGSVLTTLSCSASGIFAICCDLTRPIITRLARTFQSTRTPRCREQYMPLVALCLRHFSVVVITIINKFDFRQAQGPSAAALPKNPFIIAYADRRLDAAAQIVIDTIKEVATTHMMN